MTEKIKVPEVVAYFLSLDIKSEALAALVRGSLGDDDYINDYVNSNEDDTGIGITEKGVETIQNWAESKSDVELLSLLNGWEIE